MDSIKRQRDQIMLTFTEKGTQNITAPQIIKELAQTKFKATIGENDHRLSVRLVIQPKMTTDDWLHQLLKFVTSLSEIKQGQKK